MLAVENIGKKVFQEQVNRPCRLKESKNWTIE